MRIYELDIAWAETEGDRRYLNWELLACDEVVGVFRTEGNRVLAVLFNGDRDRFHSWARSLAACKKPLTRSAGIAERARPSDRS